MAKAKAAVPGRTEAEVTAAVLDAAKMFGLELERRNVGLAMNPAGKAVRFGKPGEADWQCTVSHGPNRGRDLRCEIKHELFDPRKLRGEKAAHFARQLDELRRVNGAGGIAVWVRDGADAARVFARVVTATGLRVEIDPDGFCWMEWEDC